ncbi:MAG TPA: FG-GAP-like repeat-containing protein [Thermoanaerobaculia bacterium]|nr:FG-GAP-like repeat-containing protein [Thermoanaerobaculia bacterium]
MKPIAAILVASTLLIASAASAATFVVPTDDELVAKAQAIVIGTVESTWPRQNGNMIETVNEIRIGRSIKGSLERNALVQIITMGGVIESRGVLVPGEAQFQQGERVLLFATEDHGRWRATDMTLGKFRFATSTRGERLLVRETEDVIGWDHQGRVHHEPVRREDAFLQFVETSARGRKGVQDYLVDSSEVVLQPDPNDERAITTNATQYPPSTYTSWVGGMPPRWPNMPAGVIFYKRSDQNMPNSVDGGVTAIQQGLAAWTSECGSAINLTYGGQIARQSANHDGANVVEYNDPQGRISGAWGGSGTIAMTYISFAGDHQFQGGTWLSITDADVVFQEGYSAQQVAYASAMTHELGHALGWRHSNEGYAGGGCNSAVEECTTAAIMNSSVSSHYGFTLQPWDVNAAQSVYPGGTCGTPPPACTAPTITTQPQSQTVSSGSTVTLTVGATGTTPLSYQWYYGASGNTSSPVPGANGPTLPHVMQSTTSFWVRVGNSCGSVNSATATVTVTSTTAASRPDFNGDGRADILWRHQGTGENYVWFMNGAVQIGGGALPRIADTSWRLVGSGDFNRDGRYDLVWRNTTTGQNYLWYMNGLAQISTAFLPAVTDLAWDLVAVADFDRDGNPDLLWRHGINGENIIWLMSNATYRASVYLPTLADQNWRIEGAADLTADANVDIVWRHTDGSNYVWFMSGTTRTGGQPLPSAAPGWDIEAIADYDGDGRADFAWRNYVTGENYMWLLNGMAVKSTAFLPRLADLNWRMSGPR